MVSPICALFRSPADPSVAERADVLFWGRLLTLRKKYVQGRRYMRLGQRWRAHRARLQLGSWLDRGTRDQSVIGCNR